MSTNPLSSDPSSVATLGWQRGSRRWLIVRLINISLLSMRCLWEIYVVMNTFFSFCFLPSVISFFSSFLLLVSLLPFIIFPLSFSSLPLAFLLSLFFFLYQEGRQGDIQTIPCSWISWQKVSTPSKQWPTFLLIIKFHIFPVLFFLPIFSFLPESSSLSHI